MLPKRVFLLGMVMLILLGATQSHQTLRADDPPPFRQGDIFIGIGYGKIKRFLPNGTLLQTLESNSGSEYQTGMCFDTVGNMYATNFDSGTMSKFDNTGKLLKHPWAGPFSDYPESCVLDSAGNIFTGEVDGVERIRKWSPAGELLDTYSAAVTDRGIDWIDLAADQCTMFYTSEGSTVKRYDVCADKQLADFATGLPRPCFALRLRPNGELLVTCRSKVFRFSPQGDILKEYDPGPGDGNLFAMNLDPDGTTFWTGGYSSGFIYRMNIETGQQVGKFNVDLSGGSSLAGIAVLGEINANLEDTDGDGLFDIWETEGLDTNSDGTMDVDLPAMGANPQVRDIFVEIDWMANDNHSHKPNPAAIERIVRAFENAPGGGINLHVDVGPESTDYVTGEKWGTRSGGSKIDHVEIIGDDVGLAEDVNAIIDDNFADARAQVFHYSIWGHRYRLNGTGSSGVSFGNDFQVFLVTLGAFDNQVGSVDQQAGTFMHELGHNLGLGHGGGDAIQHKPNYLSVMNYLFQMGGLIRDGNEGQYDYSRWDLPDLDERNLSEANGLNGGAAVARYGTRYNVNFPFLCLSDPSLSGTSLFVVAEHVNGPINWDCNIGIDDDPVQEDVNGDGQISMALHSHDDWAALDLNSGGIGQAGAPPPVVIPPEVEDELPEEMTPEDVELIQPVSRTLYLPSVIR